mmetsp:Transcript_78780/g.210367  ORF Transcript_78780/g.210367 Transcript_78780/m.210367 type:complete len:531 (-) Transcript_78780:146-1738(-)
MFVSTLLTAAVAAPVVVNTTYGPVEGQDSSLLSCAAFYGIPYAAPPTGDLRFKPPQEPATWQEAKPAHKVGNSCMQGFADGFIPLPDKLEYFVEDHHILMEAMSEDCLYLNVWTPRLDVVEGGLPVMVWFHGGSWLGGSGDKQSSIPLYDGHHMCKEGRVIVVGVNYRLGIFGFHASEELHNETGTAGNMGIQDQRAALEWVQANAHKFGGDPKRVTIFGESAGGGSVATHLAFPRSAPLFAAAIMESGGLWDVSLETASRTAAQVARAAGCETPETALECLRKVDSKDLLHAQLRAGYNPFPTADGFEIDRGVSARDLFTAGNFTGKPVVVGTNLNESALFDCLTTPMMNESAFRSHIAGELSTLGSVTPEQVDKLTGLYNASRYDSLWKRAAIDLDTDATFFCDSRTVLDAMAAKGAPTYSYLLERSTWFFEKLPCLGVPHMTELFYVWHTIDFLLQKDERSLGRTMGKHWTHFAWHHSPVFGWPEYGTSRKYLVFNGTERVAEAHHEAQCDLLGQIRSASAHATVLV